MTYFDDYEDDYILRDLRDDVCHPTFSNLLSLDCMIHNMSVTDFIHKLIHQRVTDNNVLNILHGLSLNSYITVLSSCVSS